MTTKNRFRFDGDSVTLPDGFVLTFRAEYDSYHGAPWEEECGHGPVSEWTSRAKRSGDLVLCSDRSSCRFYDFAEAMRIAKRDGWGLAPEELAALASRLGRAPTGGEIREAAVRADFERLKGWCDDKWQYVGVILTLSDPDGKEVDQLSLWGVEDCGDYYQTVAEELAGELEQRHALDLAEDFDAACRN